MRIGLHTNNLSFRGAEIAVFDYALHNQSLIFYKSKLPSEPTVVRKFEQHFKIFAYQDNDHLARLAYQDKLDLLYFIKSGGRDGYIINNVPCAVHAVFSTKVEQFHGDKPALAKYPLGYGLIEHSFGWIRMALWPRSGLSQSHSRWLFGNWVARNTFGGMLFAKQPLSAQQNYP